MKNRKTIITSFLLLAGLTLGVGYAAISNTLTVTGAVNLGTDEKNFSVVFDSVEQDANEVKRWTATINENTINSTLTVNANALDTKGDTIDVDYTIRNLSRANDLIASLGEITVTNTNTAWYTVEAGWVDSSVTELAYNETAVFNVKITLVNTPTESISGLDFFVSFTATAK